MTMKTNNPDKTMTTSNPTTANPAVNSDNADNSTTADTLFIEETATPAQSKQQRISVKQRKLDFEEYKSAYLTPMKIADRHSLNISNATWQLLERFSRILGERGSSVGCYAERIIKTHFDAYGSDLEAWRKI